jgi:hypothetical protein
MATAYASLYVSTGDGVQSVINFVFIGESKHLCFFDSNLLAGFFWCSWYTVFKNYLTLKNSIKYAPFKCYKYSANLTELNNECGESL